MIRPDGNIRTQQELLDFVASNFGNLWGWESKHKYAVFAKRKRRYHLPSKRRKELLIINDYEQVSSEHLDYLGCFSLTDSHKQLLTQHQKNDLDGIFSNWSFNIFLFMRFDYDRLQYFWEQLSAGRKELNIALYSVGECNEDHVEFPFDSSVRFPVFWAPELPELGVRHGKVLWVGVGEPPASMKYITVDVESYRPLLLGHYFMNKYSRYVMMDINSVLQNKDLLEQYKEEMGLYLVHTFAKEADLFFEDMALANERYKQTLKRIKGLKGIYISPPMPKLTPAHTAMYAAHKIWKEYKGLIGDTYDFIRIGSEEFLDLLYCHLDWDRGQWQPPTDTQWVSIIK